MAIRLLVVGAGAIGGYFGGRMLDAGEDVTFLVRPRRAALLAEAGLKIRSPRGDLTIANPPTVQAGGITGPFDAIVLSCKAFDLDDAIESFAPAVHLLARGREIFVLLRESGALRPDVDVDEALRLWTTLISGVVTQQLANAPDEPFDGGTFTSALPHLVEMFLDYYRPQKSRTASNKRSPRGNKSRSDR